MLGVMIPTNLLSNINFLITVSLWQERVTRKNFVFNKVNLLTVLFFYCSNRNGYLKPANI